MEYLVVDMTHGGLLIASELSKLPENQVYAWDIYGTLDEPTIEKYSSNNLKFVDGNCFKEPDELTVVSPVHCNLQRHVDMTHHDAVKFILNHKITVPVVEVTGVKGKTSVVWILKEILSHKKPLVLSSLGVEVFDGTKWVKLKENISITPASIIEACKLAKNYEFGICIFETSLGGTGLADVGVLTNIAENYSIAANSSNASKAKSQIFKSKLVACDQESFDSEYFKFKENTNTFGILNNSKIQPDLTATNIKYSFDKTDFDVQLSHFKTISSGIIEGTFKLSTFAPAPIHINNVIAAVSASLMLGISEEEIRIGLSQFKGLKGRTTIMESEGVRIIEEINPGLNVTAVEEAIKMMEDIDDVTVVFGGRYGVTCEEIDENSVSQVLNRINDNTKLILVDELGKNVNNLLKRNSIYYSNLKDAINYASKTNSHNILVIYRSNYSDLEKR
jgi:UDP-N-acetylmuramyl pentapeptide synthase